MKTQKNNIKYKQKLLIMDSVKKVIFRNEYYYFGKDIKKRLPWLFSMGHKYILQLKDEDYIYCERVNDKLVFKDDYKESYLLFVKVKWIEQQCPDYMDDELMINKKIQYYTDTITKIIFCLQSAGETELLDMLFNNKCKNCVLKK